MDSKTLGIASLVSAMLAFTAQDVLMKWLSGDYPLHEIVFFRASLAAMLTLVVMRFEGGLWLLRTHRLGTHLLRGDSKRSLQEFACWIRLLSPII